MAQVFRETDYSADLETTIVETIEDLPTRVCIVDSNKENFDGGITLVAEVFINSLDNTSFGVPVICENIGTLEQNFEDDDYDTIFIMDTFEGSEFDTIRKHRRILGPTALRELAMKDEQLPNNHHPLFSLSMLGLVTCFSGFRDKQHLKHLINLVRHMGGSVRSHTEHSTTHLVAKTTLSQSYRAARAFGIPIMSEEWINYSWEQRFEVDFSANSPDLMKFVLKMFTNVFICFCGFSPENKKDVENALQINGGTSVKLDDSRLTHVVCEETSLTDIPTNLPPSVYVITSLWFWSSIQENAMTVEEKYLLKKVLSSDSMSSFSSYRVSSRRKRPQRIRRVTSLFNVDSSTNTSIGPSVSEDTAKQPSFRPARRNIFDELLQTEMNYVQILETILKVKKEVLNQSQSGGPILKSPEVNIIFTNLQVIYETHSSLLQELKHVQNIWSDHVLIGPVFIKISPDLKKEYPAFINYFESSRKMLLECDKTNPRFHAFLQVCKSRPEFHRQPFHELMIRPVQRLASTALILSELKKRTNASHPDHTELEKALKEINQVVALIDEEKKKSEILSQLFEIYNLIQECPADLLASSRDLQLQFEAIELKYPGLGKPHNRLVLFVFSDVIEVCKVRAKVLHLGATATPQQLLTVTNGHPYKHLKTIPITDIQRVVDIKDNDNIVNAFSLQVRKSCDLEISSYSMQITGKNCNKHDLLSFLTSKRGQGLMANFIIERTPEEEGITTRPSGLTNPLIKALSFAYKSTFRVGTALGFHPSAEDEVNVQLPGVGGSYSTHTLPGSSRNFDGETKIEREKESVKSASLTTSLMKRL